MGKAAVDRGEYIYKSFTMFELKNLIYEVENSASQTRGVKSLMRIEICITGDNWLDKSSDELGRFPAKSRVHFAHPAGEISFSRAFA